jgi:hypothetical protein
MYNLSGKSLQSPVSSQYSKHIEQAPVSLLHKGLDGQYSRPDGPAETSGLAWLPHCNTKAAT